MQKYDWKKVKEMHLTDTIDQDRMKEKRWRKRYIEQERKWKKKKKRIKERLASSRGEYEYGDNDKSKMERHYAKER